MMDPRAEIVRNAVRAARTHELATFQRALDVQWMNNRMEDGRMGRCLALIQREADMEKEFQERTDHAAIVNAKAARETALGLEIAKVQREETCAFLRRHYLRERDPSLRQLARKLQAGYVCRDLQQQILHNEYRRLQCKAEERKANDDLRASLYSDLEALELEERRKHERCSSYGEELRQQLVSRQRQRQCQYEETLIEKKMLDDVIRTISDEDKREMEQKRLLKEKTRHEMETFAQAQRAWAEKQKQLVVREELTIERQQRAAADRSAAVIAERERRVREKEAINKKIGDKMQADEDARKEREELIRMLQEQEYLEKNINDDIAEREKLERVKRETKEALTEQMETKQRLLREHKESELRFRKEVEASIAAAEEKEREKQRGVRARNQQHCAGVRRQAAQQRAAAAARRRDDHTRAAAVRHHHAAWDAEVSEERERMMRSHAPALLGYLQAGVIQPRDLPAVSPALAPPDTPSQATRPPRFPKCNPQCVKIREY